MFIPLVSKKQEVLDLHCMRNIVLNVEMGKQEESQKTRAQPHQRTRRVEEGFRLAVFAFSLYKVECPWGQTSSCFLNVTVPVRVLV